MTDSEPMPGGLHVEDAGHPDGPPVALLHGFMSSNLQWEPNRRELEAELRLLLIEQPGHGRSPGPDNPVAYRADTVIDQIDRVRADRGIDRWWVVGQSLGGAVMIRYALRHPDRVAGLVFTNSRAVFGIAGRGGGQAVLADGPTREQIRALPYHPGNAKRIPPDLRSRMAEAADAMPLTTFRHLRSGGPWRSDDDLHRLRVPTMLINGRFEKAFQPMVDEVRNKVADLRVVDLDGGHAVNIDQPNGFNRAVLDFVHSTGPR